jgi:hypothetical protein
MSYTIMLVALADLAVIGLCVLYLMRAGRSLESQWQKQRVVLDGAQVGLERLIEQADERARALEEALGTRERQLRDLLYRLAQQEERVRTPAAVRPPRETAAATQPTLAGQAHRLAAGGMDTVEVARELAVEPAQVRVMLDLYESVQSASGALAAAGRP